MTDEREAPEDPGRKRVRDGVLGAPSVPRLSVIEGGAGSGGGASQNANRAVSGEDGGAAGGGKGEASGEDGGAAGGGKGEASGEDGGAAGGGKGEASGEDGGAAGGGKGEASGEATPEGTCPLVCLGHAEGEFYFLDVVGQHRVLKSRALVARGDLVSLFLGDTRWLFQWFPNKVLVKGRDQAGNEVVQEEVRGFSVSKAGERLMAMCRSAGLFGPHVALRGPGVWAGEEGAPIVHCGDMVMIDGEWRPTGFRSGDQVWTSAPRRVRPGLDWEGEPLPRVAQAFAAKAEAAREVLQSIEKLWKFRLEGSPIICLGLMAVGYYGVAARWRPNGYLVGGTGSGKSMLLHLLRACVPGAEYSTDTTKAGIEAAINGRPTPIYLDEAGDRQGLGTQLLLDVVLSATGGDGTRGLRGAADGGSRSFQAACSVIMAAVSPPPMGPQHKDRFTIVHLTKPGAGEDNQAAMQAATRRAAEMAPLLWGRALQGWPRWEKARLAFRDALTRAKCAARELDQMGSILAGWWVLVEDGLPSSDRADQAVLAVAEFVRDASDVAADDGPRRVVQYLASTTIQRDRSTDIEQIGVLAERAWTGDQLERDPAQRLLERFGIRIIRSTDDKGTNGKPVPRGYLDDGVWFAKSAETLRRLFVGSPFEGDRWIYELSRHPTAVESKKSVRVGGVSGPAIWISRKDWLPPEDEPPPPD
jgi:hypothetical protein